MAEYLIPNYKMEELQKKINHIKNKGANVTFEITQKDVLVPAPQLGENVNITCTQVEVEGTYIINGWRFIATIEHSSPENIIRVGDTSMAGRIPERYRTAPRECEHCHIRRDRNDTYLVYNEENDEWKQVGRTCLRSYTNGLSSEVCAEMSSVMSEISRLSQETMNDEFDLDDPEFTRNRWAYESFSMETARKKAYTYVKQHGYTSGETGNAFAKALFENSTLIDDATDEEIHEVTHWLNDVAESDWSRNAKAVWNKDSFETRDAGLLTSTVSVFLRNRERDAQRNARLNSASNTYAGNIGEVVTFTVNSVRVAYYRDSRSYYGGSYPVYKMVGTDGKIYMWGSSAGVEPHVGDTLTGRIKSTYEARNGERTTEVTRCKITGSSNNSSDQVLDSEGNEYHGFFRN